MKQHQHTKQVQFLSYYEALAFSLIDFAEKNTTFSQWLSSSVGAFTLDTFENFTSVVPQPHHVNIFTLHDEQQAVRRAQWIFWLHDNSNRDTLPAMTLLSNWAHAHEWEEPKAVVLGIEIGVLPIGIMGKMKRKHHPIDILINTKKLQALSKADIAKTSVALTGEIVQKGLIRAKGNANLLEPELGDWFFGEKTVVLYGADKNTLTLIHDTLIKANAPISLQRDTNGISAIAIPPTIYLGDIPEANTLTILQ